MGVLVMSKAPRKSYPRGTLPYRPIEKGQIVLPLHHTGIIGGKVALVLSDKQQNNRIDIEGEAGNVTQSIESTWCISVMLGFFFHLHLVSFYNMSLQQIKRPNQKKMR